MENNIINYDTNIVNDFNEVLSKGQTISDENKETIDRDFKTEEENSISNSILRIGNLFDSLSKTMENCKKVSQEYENKLIEYETTLSKEIDDIKFPSNFALNNVDGNNTTNEINLNKNDGKAITEGDSIVKESELDDSSSINKEQLADIDNNYNQEEKKIDSNSVIDKQESLNNIGNITQQNSVKLNEIDLIKENNLDNISNNINQDKQDIDDITINRVVDNKDLMIDSNNTLKDTELEDHKFDEVNNYEINS